MFLGILTSRPRPHRGAASPHAIIYSFKPDPRKKKVMVRFLPGLSAYLQKRISVTTHSINPKPFLQDSSDQNLSSSG
jgi:hypothetical protein